MTLLHHLFANFDANPTRATGLFNKMKSFHLMQRMQKFISEIGNNKSQKNLHQPARQEET